MWCVVWLLVILCSIMPNSAAPCTAAHQAPLPIEYSQARILEWVAISYQGIFLTQELNPHLLCLLLWQVFFFLPLIPPGKSGVYFTIEYMTANKNWQDKAGSTGGPWEVQKGSSECRWASETSPRVGKAWHDLGGGGRVRAAGYTGQYVETGSLKCAHASPSETSLWLAFQASIGPVAPRSGWVLTSVQCSRHILEARSPQRRRSGPWQGKISHVAFIQWIERLEPQSWPDSQGPLPTGHFRIKFFHSRARMCQAQAPVTVSVSKWGRAGVTCHWDSLWDRGPANHMGGKRPSFRGPGEASWAGGLLRAELPVWARTLGSCGQVFCSECPLCNGKAWW